jgi:hypothetical protein
MSSFRRQSPYRREVAVVDGGKANEIQIFQNWNKILTLYGTFQFRVLKEENICGLEFIVTLSYQ